MFKQNSHKAIASVDFSVVHKKIAPQSHAPVTARHQTNTNIASPSSQLIKLQRIVITTKAQSFKDIISVAFFTMLQGAKLPLFLEIYQDLDNHTISLIPPLRDLAVVQRLLQSASPHWQTNVEDLPPYSKLPFTVSASLTRQQTEDWAATKPGDQFVQSPLTRLLESALFSDDKLQQELLDRLSLPAWEVNTAITLASSSRLELVHRAKAISETFIHLFGTATGSLALSKFKVVAEPSRMSFTSFDSTNALYMTVGEISAIYHPQPEETTLPGVNHITRINPLLPRAVLHAQGPVIGQFEQKGQQVPLIIPHSILADGRPVVALGATRMGKTTTMKAILKYYAQDLKNRPTIILFDPQGEFAEDFALTCIPKSRLQETLLFELDDPDYSFRLPFLERPAGCEPSDFVDNRYALLRSLAQETWSETRMANIIKHFLATLISLPGASMWHFYQLAYDKSFRKKIISQLTDHELRFWWKRLTGQSENEIERQVGPVFNQIDKLYNSKQAARMLLPTRERV